MSEPDSIHLPTPQEVINRMLRQHSHTSAVFRRLGKILAGVGGGGALLIALLVGRDYLARPASQAPTLGEALLAMAALAIALTVGLAGTSAWVSGAFLRSDLNHYQAAQYDREIATKKVEAAVADLAALVAEAERRREADEDAMREYGRKRFEAIMDTVEATAQELRAEVAEIKELQAKASAEMAAALSSMLDEASRRGVAAGFAAAAAAFEGILSDARALLAEHAARTTKEIADLREEFLAELAAGETGVTEEDAQMLKRIDDRLRRRRDESNDD